MLDLARLRSIRLHRRPPGQRFVAKLLAADYRLPRKTDIVLDGIEHLPQDRGVFLAMNHTDRYNYWPLQYAMHCRGLRYTATWVKGKYYENAWVAGFLDAMNNIPLPSRGYVLTLWWRQTVGRKPEAQEYRWLRDIVDAGEVPPDPTPPTDGVRQFLQTRGDGSPATFLQRFDAEFDQMADIVIGLNRQALEQMHNHVLVFPQGTRSLRLSKGHTGMVQMAMHLGAAIVPVGCNGSDRVYPTNSPKAQGGRIVYRVGKPLEWTGPELAPFRIAQPFRPLSREVAREHAAALRGATDVVMARINELLEPRYQWAKDGVSDGVQGVDRFV